MQVLDARPLLQEDLRVFVRQGARILGCLQCRDYGDSNPRVYQIIISGPHPDAYKRTGNELGLVQNVYGPFYLTESRVR